MQAIMCKPGGAIQVCFEIFFVSFFFLRQKKGPGVLFSFTQGLF
jgi:hypothetical protein